MGGDGVSVVVSCGQHLLDNFLLSYTLTYMLAYNLHKTNNSYVHHLNYCQWRSWGTVTQHEYFLIQYTLLHCTVVS